MTYIDNREVRSRRSGVVVQAAHCWTDYTADRLAWLYGPNHATERAHQTLTDIAAWNALGRRDAA